MKARLLLFHFLLLTSYYSVSQSIGIGTTTPDSSAAIDISNNSKGLLIPRMNTSSINAIVNPAKGLMVYDSFTNQLKVNMGTASVPLWQTVSSKSAWNLDGNTNIDPLTQFIGSADNQPLRFRVNNIKSGELHPTTGNIFWGLRSGQSNTTGISNIAIGTGALNMNTIRSNLVAVGDSALFNNGSGGTYSYQGAANTAIGSKSLFSNTIGYNNTAIGYQSLFSNTFGSYNTSVGTPSLVLNTTGNHNTAVGFESLNVNTIGSENTAVGSQSLTKNTTGINNTAIGHRTLVQNITGSSNTALGGHTLVYNTTGGNNTGLGQRTLVTNTTGSHNTAVGGAALIYNTLGNENTAVGVEAMAANTVGQYNTAVGRSALANTTISQFNTVLGYFAGAGLNHGYNNVFIGAYANTNQNGLYNCVAIGESSLCTGNSQVRLGNYATVSIGGVVGYSNLSDGRFKNSVQEDVKGIDFIMKLRPVTYKLDMEGLNRKYNNAEKKVDDMLARGMKENANTIFSGFVAQEVEEAANSIGYAFSGVDKPKNENDVYGLRYSEFVVPLVKAVQEQQKMIDDLKKQIEELKRVTSSNKVLSGNQ